MFLSLEWCAVWELSGLYHYLFLALSGKLFSYKSLSEQTDFVLVQGLLLIMRHVLFLNVVCAGRCEI